jgi:hypothetical protein
VRKHAKTTRNSTRRFRRLSLTTVVVATVLLAIAAITVVSRQNARVNASSVPERSSAVDNNTGKKFVKVTVAGQEVEVDSQTGQVKELTPEEARKLAAGLKQMVNKSAKDLEEVHHPDGSSSLDLEGRFQNVTVAKVDEDGNLTQSCVDNPKAAGKFFGIDPKLIKGENEDPRNPATLNKTQN